MAISFEYGEGVPWYPESDLHDWRSEWLAHIAIIGEGERPPLYLVENGDYRQEITETNTTVFLNSVYDPMDAVYIIDQRDETSWKVFRGLHVAYAGVVAKVLPYATLVQTNCPLPVIEGSYYQLQKESEQAHEEQAAQIAAELDDELSKLLGNNDL